MRRHVKARCLRLQCDSDCESQSEVSASAVWVSALVGSSFIIRFPVPVPALRVRPHPKIPRAPGYLSAHRATICSLSLCNIGVRVVLLLERRFP